MNTKVFPLRVVLTVTTGRLLTEPKDGGNGIGDLYQILNHITGESLFTHQLPRASKACAPVLLNQFPELAPVNACLDKLDGWLKVDRTGGQEAIKMWLTECRMMFPEIKDEYEIEPLTEGWTTMDPILEAEAMVGKKKLIVVKPARS